jgi:hypothetical protein
MQHGTVLDVAIGADHDPFGISAKNGIKPDVCIGFEPDGADDRCIVGNEVAITFQQRNAILETVDQTAFA